MGFYIGEAGKGWQGRISLIFVDELQPLLVLIVNRQYVLVLYLHPDSVVRADGTQIGLVILVCSQQEEHLQLLTQCWGSLSIENILKGKRLRPGHRGRNYWLFFHFYLYFLFNHRRWGRSRWLDYFRLDDHFKLLWKSLSELIYFFPQLFANFLYRIIDKGIISHGDEDLFEVFYKLSELIVFGVLDLFFDLGEWRRVFVYVPEIVDAVLGDVL